MPLFAFNMCYGEIDALALLLYVIVKLRSRFSTGWGSGFRYLRPLPTTSDLALVPAS